MTVVTRVPRACDDEWWPVERVDQRRPAAGEDEEELLPAC
jgi:hypothetical protein